MQLERKTQARMEAKMKVNKSPQRGFTLIEIILVISILVIVMGVAYGALSQIIETKTILDDEREVRSTLNAFTLRFTKDLQGAQPESILPDRKNMNQPRPGSLFILGETQTYEGKRLSSVTFSTFDKSILNNSENKDGNIQVKYYIEQQDGNLQLIREATPKLGSPEESYAKTESLIFANNVSEFTLDYFSRDDSKWFQRWGDGKNVNFPGILQYTVTLKTKNSGIKKFTGSIAFNDN